MAVCEVGSGRVVAVGAGWSIRNGSSYAPACDIEQLMDVMFRWLASPTHDKLRSQIKVLWYEGYGVYSQNYKVNCPILVNWLINKGYVDANIVASNVEPISDIYLDSYDILFLPQLQLGEEAIGGEPELIPPADYAAMERFVKELGKGLLVLEGGDYASSAPGHNFFRVSNALINNTDNWGGAMDGMYFQPDQIKVGGPSGAFQVSYVVSTDHWIGSTYNADYGGTCILASVCSMTTTPEPPRPGVLIEISPSFEYGAPGDTLSYEVTVTNSGTIVDNYNLTADDSAGWGVVTLSTYKLTNVEPKTSRTVSLSITIPSTTSRGSSTNITVTAISENDSSVSKSAKGSAHAAQLPVDPVLGVWTSVYTSPRVLNYGVGVWGAGENIYILSSYSSGVGSSSDYSNYGRGLYFMRYNTVTGYWEDLSTPSFTFKNGAHEMCWDHGNYIYAVPGGSYADAAGKVVHAFCRYNIANDSWETLPDTPMWQGTGDALVWVKLGANEYIYAWLGTTSYSVIMSGGTDPYAELWCFNITENSWDSQFLKHVKGYFDYPSAGANAAQAENGYGADDGTNLVWTGGDYIYYTPGAYTESLINKDEEKRFLRYTISSNTLAEMASPPDTGNGGIDDGGSMVYPGSGDYIYVIKGGDDTGSGGGSPGYAFWRYKISNNTWETLDNLPVGVSSNNGCRICYAGSGKICYWVGPSGTGSDKNLYVYGIEAAGVDVSVSPSENSAENGETVTFTVTVTNTGTVSDNYTFENTDNASWTKSLSKSSVGPLSPHASENVTLTVTIPGGATPCTRDSITITATSHFDNTVKDNASCIAHATTVVERGVEVSISPGENSAENGETVTFTVTVTNTGAVSDNYTLENSDNLGWSLTLSPLTLSLGVGASGTATLTVAIPATAENCTRDNITVTATSSENVTIENSATCVAHCLVGVAPPPLGGVQVTISANSKSGKPGDELSFAVVVTNTGTGTDTFSVTAEDTENWAPTVSPTSFSLNAGGSRNISLRITIPSTAADGDSTTITVTATGTGYENSATCTATAQAADGGVSPVVYVGIVIVIVAILGAVLIFIKPF
jgi:fimbrial isopeptide formation D2 family protein